MSRLRVPARTDGAVVYLADNAGGFSVRKCPDPERLAAFIVAACNAYAGTPAGREAIRAASIAEPIAGRVFAGCSSHTVDRLALAAGGTRWTVHGVEGFEWRFPDGSALRVAFGVVEYGRPPLAGATLCP